MRVSRRAVAWIFILGLVIALVFVQQRHRDSARQDLADGAPVSMDDAGAQQFAAATTSVASPADSVDSTDESIRCARTLDEAASFAKTEHSTAPGKSAEPSSEWMLAELGNLQSSLAGSRDPEQFLTVLLLDPPEARASNDQSAYTTLRDLGERAASSNSPLLAWHALRICVDAKALCQFAQLEQRLLEADRSNAEAWALVAMLRHRRGDVAGALAAMQGAARASTSTSYWLETAVLLERSMATGTAIPYPDRMHGAFGAAAAALSSQPGQVCRAESATSRAWAEACLAYGTLSAEHNETVLARAVGLAIRQQALMALGDRERAAEVAAERAFFEAERNVGMPEMRGAMAVQRALIDADRARLPAWLAAVRESGESGGLRRFLRQELPPLLERAGLLEREGARECAAQFFEPPAAAGTRAATAGHRIEVADRLLISVRGGTSLTTMVQVRPDGTITLPRVPGIAALGKTTEQLEREIETLLPGRDIPPEVLAILLAPRSRADLRREFDAAWKETAEQ